MATNTNTTSTRTLTPKQERFVAEYLIDLNASRAAKAAGYAEHSAEVTGCKLLRNPKVAKVIEKSRLKTAGKLEITFEKVLTDLEDLKKKAADAGQYSAAIRAAELQGKHVGMFVERIGDPDGKALQSQFHLYLPDNSRAQVIDGNPASPSRPE